MVTQSNNSNPANPPKGFEAKLAQALNGAKNLPASGFSASIDGASFDGPGLIAKLSAMLQPYTDARAAKGAWSSKVAAKKAQAKASKAFFSQLNTVVVNALTASSPILGQMGLQARKTPAPLPTEKKLIKVAKANATRVARGTTGPRQKAVVKGTVGDLVVSPDGTVTPAAATPAATPAPAPAPVTATPPVNGSRSP